MRLLLSARLARAVAKGDGGRDSEQPAKNRGGEHDPHERRVRRADDPVQLHGSRIRGDENDKHGQGRHREPCPRIESGVAAVANQPARLAEQVEQEVRHFLPQLNPYGAIVMHDASSHLKTVREAALKLEAEGLISVVLMPTPRGLVLAQKRQGRK